MQLSLSYPSRLFQNLLKNNNIEGSAAALPHHYECKTSSIVKRGSEKMLPVSFLGSKNAPPEALPIAVQQCAYGVSGT